MFIRLKIAESPEFQTTKDKGLEVKVPLAAVFKNNFKAVLLVAGSFLGFGAFSIVVMTFLVGYSQNTLGIPASAMLSFTMIAFVLQIPMILLSGHLSDKYGRKVLVVFGTLAAIAAIIFMFAAVTSAQPALIGVAYALGFGCLYTFCYGMQPALFADSFPAEVRFTGMSLGYQLGNVVGLGIHPAHCHVAGHDHRQHRLRPGIRGGHLAGFALLPAEARQAGQPAQASGNPGFGQCGSGQLTPAAY